MSSPKYSRLDLVFWSAGAGWSVAELCIDDHVERLGPTHVFNNPHEEIARATVELIEGQSQSSFLWLDEPGTYAFELVRADKSPTIRGRYRSFDETYPQRVPDQAIADVEVAFTTHLPYWVALVHASLARTRELARHSLYSSWNNIDVPTRELAVLEKYLHDLRIGRE